ncbi:hypothetical protein GWK47_007799 [Chionoecetes opilio]|uniref:Chitin-binding type-4 domain-containing protein n=1 Tax=Chionoecetes opilio TaxID=41210 RepID=A0A8J5CR72_CHIOP|nr:hypothetical protein GWK47_007799 [Chionoecetes opilio]
MLFPCAAVSLLLALLSQTQGHMSLQEPPARNVLWRMGYSHLPPHLDDDYLICSQEPHAPCPPCGDPAGHRDPGRTKEAASGPRGSSAGPTLWDRKAQRIPVEVNVTNNHGGLLEFRLCPHDDPGKPVDQHCLDQYPLEIVGQKSRAVKLSAPHHAQYNSQEMVTVEVKLPVGITCDQCVLQMSNTAEEFQPMTVMFRNCADIAIQGTAKTSLAGGSPLAHPPSDFHTRSGPANHFPEQKQHLFYG